MCCFAASAVFVAVAWLLDLVDAMVMKVALRDRLEELTDGQLAPAAAEGSRLLFVSGIGQTPEPASVIAVNKESW